MFAIIGGIALALASAGASAPAKAPAQKDTLQGLFKADDYPVEALDRNEQGGVGVLVRIDETGAASDCIVEKSSGSVALDKKTCDVIRERAKFAPTVDRSGRSVPREMRKTITWRIAEDLAPSNPLTIRTVVEIGPYGQGTSCLLELGGALKPPPGTPPAVCPVSRLRVDFSNDTRFGGAIDRIISEQIFWPGPSAPPQPVEPGPGQALVGRLVLRLEIDATGKLTSCKLLEHVGSQPFVDPCPAIPKQYAARKGADGKPRPFSATQIFSTLVEVDRNRQPPGNLRNMLQGLISSDDYPPEALDNGEEGTVGILLRIDPAGAVGDCIVEQASGSALLDNKTCEVMRQRAKFKPALDKQGRPTGGEYRTHIKWQIAEDRLPSDPWVSRMVISFGPNGRASSCRMELEGAMKPPAGTPALGCPPAALQVPAPGVDDQAGPTATLVTETRFEVGSASPPPLVPGGTVVISQVLSLAIDASGTLTSCKIVATSPAGSNPDACSSVGKYYEPRKGPDGTPAPFEATETIVSIARR